MKYEKLLAVLVGLLVLALSLAAIPSAKPAGAEAGQVQQLEELSLAVSNLTKRVKQIETQVGPTPEGLSLGNLTAPIWHCVTNLWGVEGRLLALESARTSKSVDLYSKDFVPYSTDMGILLLEVRDAQPYLNGYRIKLAIGNCQCAQLGNCEISLAWGRSGQHTHAQTIPGPFLPGKWTSATVTLSPVAPQEVKTITAALHVSSVSLHNQAASED